VSRGKRRLLFHGVPQGRHHVRPFATASEHVLALPPLEGATFDSRTPNHTADAVG